MKLNVGCVRRSRNASTSLATWVIVVLGQVRCTLEPEVLASKRLDVLHPVRNRYNDSVTHAAKDLPLNSIFIIAQINLSLHQHKVSSFEKIRYNGSKKFSG